MPLLTDFFIMKNTDNSLRKLYRVAQYNCSVYQLKDVYGDHTDKYSLWVAFYAMCQCIL